MRRSIHSKRKLPSTLYEVDSDHVAVCTETYLPGGIPFLLTHRIAQAVGREGPKAAYAFVSSLIAKAESEVYEETRASGRRSTVDEKVRLMEKALGEVIDHTTEGLKEVADATRRHYLWYSLTGLSDSEESGSLCRESQWVQALEVRPLEYRTARVPAEDRRVIPPGITVRTSALVRRDLEDVLCRHFTLISDLQTNDAFGGVTSMLRALPPSRGQGAKPTREGAVGCGVASYSGSHASMTNLTETLDELQETTDQLLEELGNILVVQIWRNVVGRSMAIMIDNSDLSVQSLIDTTTWWVSPLLNPWEVK